MFSIVYEKEGISGFYQGVIAVMIGQAFIKSTLFAANTYGISVLVTDGSNAPNALQLCLAGCFSGFVGKVSII